MATAIDHSTTFLLGRLNWSAVPTDPIVLSTFVVVAIGGAAVTNESTSPYAYSVVPPTTFVATVWK